MRQEQLEAECGVIRYRLEIRNEASGDLVKTVIGDKETNTVTAEYPDGTTEVIGAFE